MRYIIVGGGSGGHIYPALAIADALKTRHPEVEILYVGRGGKTERQILLGASRPFIYSYKSIRSSGLPRPFFSHRLPVFFLNLIIGFIQSLFILIRFHPDVVIGTGGFATVQMIVASWLYQIPIFIHEQNATPGLANYFLSHFATRIGVSWPESIQSFPIGKAVVVGYPVRKNLTRGDRSSAKKLLGFEHGTPIIFAFGGSQGARTINRAMASIIPALINNHHVGVILSTGNQQSSTYQAYAETVQLLRAAGLSHELPGRLLVKEYFDNIQNVYDAADLVVARSGAGTIMELAALGIPAILIPKAGLPGNHQLHNAHLAEAVRGAVVIQESRPNPNDPETVDSHHLLTLIKQILEDDTRRITMSKQIQALWTPDAIEKIVTELDGLPQVVKTSHKPPVHWYVLGLAIQMLQRAEGGTICSDGDFQKHVQSFLSSPNWRVRNIGVKLVGKHEDQSFLPILLTIIVDKTPAPWFERWFGGDYFNVGFIRRNCIRSIREIGIFSQEIKAVLVMALKDPYWEVRVEAVAALGNLCPLHDLDRDQILKEIGALTHDPAFEVICQVVHTLSLCSTSPAVVSVFQELYYKSNRKVKQAVYKALETLYQRGVIRDIKSLKTEQSEIFIPGGYND